MNWEAIIRAQLLLLGLAITVSDIQGQVELEKLQLKYRVEREVFNKPLVTLRDQYKARLVDLQDKYTKDGDLDKALAAKAAAAASRDPVAEEIDSSPSEIARVQKTFLQQRASRVLRKHASLLALNRAYTDQLSKLRTRLTKAGELDQATAVDAEIKKVSADSMIMKSLPKEAKEWRGHYYLMVEEKVTWKEAMARCNHLQGHIVTISDREENEFVLKRTGKNYCWLGATDEVDEGKWLWVTGEPFTFKGWWPGRPDSASPDEDYALCRIQSSGGGWGDADAKFKCHFMCEWEPYDKASGWRAPTSTRDDG